MAEKKRGLGRGLESLLGIFDDENENDVLPSEDKIDRVLQHEIKNAGGIIEVDLNLIDSNSNQPRKNFDPTALKELADSIKTHGVIQPIILNKAGSRYLIVAGERRYRASKIAGLKTIPSVIKEYTGQQVREISLLENIQREDLNPIEAGRAMKELLELYGWTQEELANRLGKSRPAVTNLLRLLELTPEVVQLVESGKLSPGHARSLVVVKDPVAQLKLAQLATEKKITVRDMENAVKESQGSPKAKIKRLNPVISIEFKSAINQVQRRLSTKVSYTGNENKGKLIIDYYNRDDLERILEILS